MIIPLPTILLATIIEKPPKHKDTYFALIRSFGFGKIRFGYWLKYK